MKRGSCSKCEKVNDECSKEQVVECLKNSNCDHCESMMYHYPYGRDESRHCTICGAEWSIWK